MSPASIELLVLDVDGVLTDGRITLSSEGAPSKAFYVRDGVAIKLWRQCGGELALLSGRSEPSVGVRAAELGIKWVRTGIRDKLDAYAALLGEAGCRDEVTAYLGDDLPDLAPMMRCGFPVAVANAAPAVKQVASYVTRCRGGGGAVAELVELLLRRRGAWNRDLLSTV